MTDVQRGQKLKQMREAAGLTQPEVGRVLGIGKQAVSSWEGGKSKPSLENLAKLEILYRDANSDGAVFRLYGLNLAAEDFRPARQSELTQLRAEFDRLARRVDGLALVVESELGLELGSLLDVEESTATPDETGPDGVARPAQ